MSFTKLLSPALGASLLSCAFLTSCDVDWRGRRDISEESEKDQEREETIAALDRTRKALEDERTQKKLEDQARAFEEKAKALEAKAKQVEQSEGVATTLAEQRKLEDERLAVKFAEEQRLAEEEAKQAELELEREKREEFRRLSACERFKGKKFDKLTLESGEELDGLTVTSADAIGVTFMHAHGIKRIPFTNLPESIRKECMYDPDAAKRRKQLEAKIAHAQFQDQQELERLDRERKLKLKQITTFGSSDTKKPEPAITSPEISAANAPTTSTTPAVKPRGTVTVTLGGVNQRDSRYVKGQKLLKIKAISNVPAYLYVDGSSVVSLTPNVPVEVDRVTSYTGEYTVTLKTATGQTLDEERHNRKTGLTTGGL